MSLDKMLASRLKRHLYYFIAIHQRMKAIVRNFPKSYQALYLPKGININLSLARKQHKEYIKSLKWLGLKVDVLPADEKLPDCVFVEDCAVVHNGKALITNIGSDYRKRETEAVKAYFEKSHDIIEMKPPAILEGGDVLVTEDNVYVGMSKVTNRKSIIYLKQLCDRKKIINIPVKKTLHLKTACSYIGNNTLLVCSELIPQTYFKKLRLILIPKEESYASNSIAINNKILVPMQAKKTIVMLQKEDFEVKPINISEFMKGEGSLTCLSIIY